MRLRDYLTAPVDFPKMNIEGAEWEVLADSEDRLGLVREMVVESHYLPGVHATLHGILAMLHRQSFEYLVDDFDSESGGIVAPFTLGSQTQYYALIYARRGLSQLPPISEVAIADPDRQREIDVGPKG